jgi:hypothetical protein
MRRPSLRVTVLDQTADFGILVPSVGVVVAAAAAEKRIQTLLFYFILFYFFASSSSCNVPIVSKVSPRAIESAAHLRINGPPQHACPGRAPPHLSSAPLTFVVSGLFFFPFLQRRPAELGPHHGDHE